MAASSLRQLDADFDKIQKKLQEGWARQKHLSEQFTAKLKGGDKEGHIGLIESQRLRVKNIDSAIVASRQPGYFELYEHPPTVKQIETKGELKQLTMRIRDVERELEQLRQEEASIVKQKKEMLAMNPPQVSSLQQWFGTYGKPEKPTVPGFMTNFQKDPKTYGGTKHHSAFKTLSKTMKPGRLIR
jgi:hypothetical protein|eukprot:Stramenopile-MAST_4_protein_2340